MLRGKRRVFRNTSRLGNSRRTNQSRLVTITHPGEIRTSALENSIQKNARPIEKPIDVPWSIRWIFLEPNLRPVRDHACFGDCRPGRSSTKIGCRPVFGACRHVKHRTGANHDATCNCLYPFRILPVKHTMHLRRAIREEVICSSQGATASNKGSGWRALNLSSALVWRWLSERSSASNAIGGNAMKAPECGPREYAPS